jgi:hypothetical protein
MIFLQHNPLSAIASASVLVFLAYRYNFVGGLKQRGPGPEKSGNFAQ